MTLLPNRDDPLDFYGKGVEGFVNKNFNHMFVKSGNFDPHTQQNKNNLIFHNL